MTKLSLMSRLLPAWLASAPKASSKERHAARNRSWASAVQEKERQQANPPKPQ